MLGDSSTDLISQHFDEVEGGRHAHVVDQQISSGGPQSEKPK